MKSVHPGRGPLRARPASPLDAPASRPDGDGQSGFGSDGVRPGESQDTRVSAPSAGVMTERAAIEVEDLLKIVLGLAVVWLVLEIVGEVVGLFTALLGPLRPLLGLAVVALIALWFLDYI